MPKLKASSVSLEVPEVAAAAEQRRVPSVVLGQSHAGALHSLVRSVRSLYIVQGKFRIIGSAGALHSLVRGTGRLVVLRQPFVSYTVGKVAEESMIQAGHHLDRAKSVQGAVSHGTPIIGSVG